MNALLPTETMVKKRKYERKSKRLNAYILQGEHRHKPKKQKDIIDLDQVAALAGIGCTQEEMAAILGCSTGYIQSERERNPSFLNAMEVGGAEMRSSLRRTQLKMALSGNVSMLIWLGKQMLGQSDQQRIDHKTEINITVSKAMEELRNIPKGQLLASRKLLRGGEQEHETIIDNPAQNPEDCRGGTPCNSEGAPVEGSLAAPT